MIAKSADILPFLGAVTKRIRRTQAASPNVVLLHVGHGKTGSSYLQSALANSSEPLGAHDIAYPIVRGNVARTRAGNFRPIRCAINFPISAPNARPPAPRR